MECHTCKYWMEDEWGGKDFGKCHGIPAAGPPFHPIMKADDWCSLYSPVHERENDLPE